MFDTGKRAADIIAAEGLAQITDTSAIEKIAREVVAKSPDNVAKYRSGNEGVFKFFVGQVMRETRGQANPQVVNEIVKRVLARIVVRAPGMENPTLLKEGDAGSRFQRDGRRRQKGLARGLSRQNLVLYFYPKAEYIRMHARSRGVRESA